MYQSEVLGPRSNTRYELGFERRWCWWRCWWIWTPSRWEDQWWWFPPPRGMFPQQNSSAEALDWFRPGSASRQRCFVPKASFWFFFQGKRHHIAKDGHRRTVRGPTRPGARPGDRARPPPLWLAGGPLWYFLHPIFFIYSKMIFCEVSGLLVLCRIGL